MRGLRSIVSWRTFMTGFVVGYIVAWGLHRSVMFQTVDSIWVEEKIPFLIPEWSQPRNKNEE